MTKSESQKEISAAAEPPVPRARDLLAAATPRPWRYLGGAIPDEDYALIIRAVNEYEALLDIADTARVGRAEGWYMDNPVWNALEDALTRLDAGKARESSGTISHDNDWFLPLAGYANHGGATTFRVTAGFAGWWVRFPCGHEFHGGSVAGSPRTCPVCGGEGKS